jgi:hypothetical protein
LNQQTASCARCCCAAAKPVLFVLCLLPLAWLIYGAATDGLGANPAEALIRSCGDWTLRFLCLTLAVTPCASARARQLARFRRMLGLFVIFYASCTCWPIPGWTWADAEDIARDIFKRPFILVGFSCWLLLWPLALTFNRAVRWLGGRVAGAASAYLLDRRAGAAAFFLDARRQEQLCRGAGLRADHWRLVAGAPAALLHAAPSFVRALTWARQNSRTQRAQSFAKDAKDSEIQRSR